MRDVDGIPATMVVGANGFGTSNSVALYYLVAACAGQPYATALSPADSVTFPGHLTNGYLRRGVTDDRGFESSRLAQSNGNLGDCDNSPSAGTLVLSVPVYLMDMSAELGILVGPFSIVR